MTATRPATAGQTCEGGQSERADDDVCSALRHVVSHLLGVSGVVELHGLALVQLTWNILGAAAPKASPRPGLPQSVIGQALYVRARDADVLLIRAIAKYVKTAGPMRLSIYLACWLVESIMRGILDSAVRRVIAGSGAVCAATEHVRERRFREIGLAESPDEAITHRSIAAVNTASNVSSVLKSHWAGFVRPSRIKPTVRLLLEYIYRRSKSEAMLSICNRSRYCSVAGSVA